MPLFCLNRFAAFLCILACAFSAKALDGKSIYKKQCAECHGKNGEGVKDKYDQALHGDRTLDRLVRYIDKNMPEDNPDKINAKEAEAVGRYIYESFYSLEARLRKNPPRIEVARLTNRQYTHAVSDLIGRFLESEWKTGGSEHGLRGTYHDSRNFARDKKLYDRVDPEIRFDFGNGGPEKTTTNEFSISWRGSVIADETGVFEFIVKTPNGTRLWVNDEQEPLIDEWVSSPETMEHRASIKLLGGRAYSLRLECFRYRDKHSAISLMWKPPHGPEQVIPPQNLSTERLGTAFVLKTQFPADDSSVGYERGVAVSKEWDEATTRAALEVAAYVTKNLDRLSDSKVADTNRAAKVEKFCEKFVATAFRRPLNVEEKKIYVGQQFKGVAKSEEAVKRVVLLALKSPRFLYLGAEGKNADAYEVASRLSFGLWDSLPDTELLIAVEKGELKTETQVKYQAQRMLKNPRARAKVRYFLSHWLEMERGEDLAKDSKLFPEFTPEIAADLRSSLYKFLDDVVWRDSSDYRQLVQADYLFLNQRLAKFYGVEVAATNEFVKVKFDSSQRAGVITHPFLLAALSYTKTTSPIHRGVFLTRNIVGRSLKMPPVAVAFNEADFDPNLTMREKITQLTKPNNCQGCHSVINPLGFSLESFDAVGRFRTEDNGKPVNTLSEFATEEGKTIQLSGPRDIANFSVTSPDAQEAFIEQLFHQVVKQPIIAYGRNVMDQLRQSFAASGCNIQKLLVEIATISALHDAQKPKKS